MKVCNEKDVSYFSEYNLQIILFKILIVLKAYTQQSEKVSKTGTQTRAISIVHQHFTN